MVFACTYLRPQNSSFQTHFRYVSIEEMIDTSQRKGYNMKDTRKLSRTQRLKEIAHILTRGVLRMREANMLLESENDPEERSLRKPLQDVNQRVSG